MPTPSSKGPKALPTASEYGQLIAFIAKMGMTQTAVKAVLGTGVKNRTRAEIAQALREWLKTL